MLELSLYLLQMFSKSFLIVIGCVGYFYVLFKINEELEGRNFLITIWFSAHVALWITFIRFIVEK